MLVTSQVRFSTVDVGPQPAQVNVSRFEGTGGVDEYHIVIRPTAYGSTEAQLEWVQKAYAETLASLELPMQTAVLRRFFCSDLVNQAEALRAKPFSDPENQGDPCAVSWVCQPPVPPVKVALWAYHVNDSAGDLEKSRAGATLSVTRGELTHHWTTNAICDTTESSHDQTEAIIEDYKRYLDDRGMTLADNVLRTWFFVQNVDADYQGLVVARRNLFAKHGLTPETHFIASTGIQGGAASVAAKVAMDAYAISGVRPEQIEHLSALDHLSPTHVYGVTFERATALSFRDRRHVIVSGTASIDHRGNILHPGDVSRQLDRTLENVEALLKQAGATLRDMCVFVVYVRDPSDHALAWQRMRERFGDAPVEVVVAPVCRPGWLIEVEGVAVVSASNPDLPAF